MSFEPKKMALMRILEILHENTDPDHPVTQEEIIRRLRDDYGIELKRKAVGDDLAVLKDAGYDIVSTGSGSYLNSREFEDPELVIAGGRLCFAEEPALNAIVSSCETIEKKDFARLQDA